MADIVVFLGPTLAATEARMHLDALYLPPVGQGDVMRAVAEHAPTAIAIIDGVFAQRPAVRHKEILWAMSQGVSVHGASSMGAIRAAELCDFGMIGHGLVYRWFRRTRLADDADVAVAMAPAEFGSRALSEALVDMRLQLKRAEREGVIGRALRLQVEGSARALHFTERSFDLAMAGLDVDDAQRLQRDALAAWLAGGIVGQKKRDAIGMLETLGSPSSRAAADGIPGTFELTDAFAYDLKYSNLDGLLDKRIY